MNGARCRLSDIIELLSDANLGREMHSVISQGRVDSIVHSKPRERRLLIEEAAGKTHALAGGLLLVDLKRGGLGPALQELALRTQELFGVKCRYQGPAEVDRVGAEAAVQLYRIAQEAAANAACGPAPNSAVCAAVRASNSSK